MFKPSCRRHARHRLRRRVRLTSAAGLVLALTTSLGAQSRTIAAWRAQHERQIVDELLQLVAVPNVAGNDADMRRNADLLEALFVKRGFKVEKSDGPGSPVVFAAFDVPSARGTLTLYIHYDGQPVTAAEWTRCGPFVPCVYGPTGPVALDPARTTFDPQWRVYGRSASDDKGPIVAVLSAVEALRATGSGPAWNLRVVLDGEEEAGSGNFRRFAAARAADLKADLAMTLDGPRHPSGRPTLYFGVRGGAGMTLTVYGAKNDLHSGNYGNWAPDPSMRLARLLATMKDDRGRVTIDGFYRDVVPLTPAELAAIDEMPNVEVALKKDFLVALPERGEERLERKLNEPTLSILAMESGGGTHAPARSAIPASASARLEMRLVNGLEPGKQNALVVEHIRKQGYFVVEGRDPSDVERLSHALVARVDLRGGSTAPRVSLDEPMARAVVAALTRDGRDLARQPTLGGSMPFATFSTQMPTVGFSMVNHDNNQHGPDENLRLQNLWEGIEMMAAIMTMPKPSNP
jgi:acetylornithine deacetylase/succinyl-diaminopimelate desuccinylase-like protein